MKKIGWLLVVIFTLSGCEDSISVENEQRIERFSCKVDGKLWVADDDSEFLTGYKGVNVNYLILDRGVNEPKRFIHIDAYNNGNYPTNNAKESGISIECDSLYAINAKSPLSGDILIYTDFQKNTADWTEYTIIEGSLTMKKIDTITFMAQGEFEFTAYNKEKNQTVKVTEGRFNTKYIR